MTASAHHKTPAALEAAILVALLCLPFFGFELLSGQTLPFTNEAARGMSSVGSDIWHLHYPLKHFYAQELSHWRLPFWNPYISTGFPVFAEGQVAALYPPNLVLFGLLPLPLAFNLSILFHVVLGGAAAALLAQHFGARHRTYLIAAVGFAFCGFFVAHLKHINMVAVVAWAPLFFTLLDRLATQARAATGLALAGVVSCMWLAGHPQMTYYTLLLGAGLCLFRIVGKLRDPDLGRRQGQVRGLTFGSAALYLVVCGSLLAAPQLFPSLKLLAVSPQEIAATFERADQLSYPPRNLVTFLSPYHFGDPGRVSVGSDPNAPQRIEDFEGFDRAAAENFFWEITGYVGWLPLILTATALVLALRERRWPALVPLVILIPSVLLMLGKYGGLARLAYAVLPGFDLFRIHARFIAFVGLALVVLSAIGLTLLIDRLRVGQRPALVMVGVAVALVFVDLHVTFSHHNPQIPTERWQRTPATLQRVAAEEASQATPFRVAHFSAPQVFANAYYRAEGWAGDLKHYQPAHLVALPNLCALYDVACTGHYFPNYPRWMAEPLYPNLFNVRYVVTPHSPQRPFRTAGLGLELLQTFPGDRFIDETVPYDIQLYRNPNALPRAFLVPEAIDGTHDGPQRLASSDFDPRRTVVLASAPPASTTAISREPIDVPVIFESYTPQRVELQVDAPRPSWLYLSDTFDTGWHAAIDGEAVEVFRANEVGRAVQVPPGRHRVVFTYRAPGFGLGVGLAILGGVLLLCWPALYRLIQG